MHKRRIKCDTGTEKGATPSIGIFSGIRVFHRLRFCSNTLLGSVFFCLSFIVSQSRSFDTILFKALKTRAALPARINEIANSHSIANLITGQLRVTTPAISRPGTTGNVDAPHSSGTWCMSEWQIPQY